MYQLKHSYQTIYAMYTTVLAAARLQGVLLAEVCIWH